MLDLLEKALNKVELKPSDFVDVRYAYSAGETFTVRNGRFDSISNQVTGGVAVRALIDNAWGFTSTIQTDLDSVVETIKKAVKIAQLGSKYASYPRKISDKWVYEGTGATKMEIDPREIDKDEKFELITTIEKSAREFSDNIVQASSTYQETHMQEFIVNNKGTKVANEVHAVRLMKSAVGRQGTNMQTVFDSIGGTGGWELIQKWDPKEEGEKSAQQAEELLKAPKPPSGKMNVIMDPSLTGVFIHEAFGHACEADAIISKNSVLEGKLGERVGVEGVNVMDDPTIPGLRGSFEYDSEGTKTRKRVLVKDGILQEYFHSLETASYMGVEPNGAGRAMNFNVPPIPRMGNTYVDAGDMTLEEIAELTKDGVYLKNSYGGYVMPAKGQFYFTCQYGYVIKDGEIDVMFGNVGLSGMILEVLVNAYGIGNKWEPAFLGTCGKGGQWVPVTGGGPNIGVSGLVVGGQR